jgi:hypothetical protein
METRSPSEAPEHGSTVTHAGTASTIPAPQLFWSELSETTTPPRPMCEGTVVSGKAGSESSHR